MLDIFLPLPKYCLRWCDFSDFFRHVVEVHYVNSFFTLLTSLICMYYWNICLVNICSGLGVVLYSILFISHINLAKEALSSSTGEELPLKYASGHVTVK